MVGERREKVEVIVPHSQIPPDTGSATVDLGKTTGSKQLV